MMDATPRAARHQGGPKGAPMGERGVICSLCRRALSSLMEPVSRSVSCIVLRAALLSIVMLEFAVTPSRAVAQSATPIPRVERFSRLTGRADVAVGNSSRSAGDDLRRVK